MTEMELDTSVRILNLFRISTFGFRVSPERHSARPVLEHWDLVF